jgi:hypothetical protein
MTAAAVRSRQPTNLVVPGVADAGLVQVVAPGGHIMAASAAGRGLPPMTTAWPTPHDPRQQVRTCAEPRMGCVRVSAVRVRPTPDSPVVYAPDATFTGVLDTIFAVQAAGQNQLGQRSAEALTPVRRDSPWSPT